MIYFIRCDNSVKIGHSKEPVKRLASLQTGNPQPLTLLMTEPGGVVEEAAYHARFSSLRIAKTEWFHLTGELEKFLERWCSRGLTQTSNWPCNKTGMWLGPAAEGIGAESYTHLAAKCPAGSIVLDLTHGSIDDRAKFALLWLLDGDLELEEEVDGFLDWAAPDCMVLFRDESRWTLQLIYIPMTDYSDEDNEDDEINDYAPQRSSHGHILSMWDIFDYYTAANVEIRMYWDGDSPLFETPIHFLGHRPICQKDGTALVPVQSPYPWITGHDAHWIPAP